MSNSLVRSEDGDGLAVLTLDNPPLNLYTREVGAEFASAMADLAAAPPRTVLIRAEGRVVSAGVDVSIFSGLDRAGAAKLWRDQIETVAAIEALPVPVVFAAHGLCLTAMFEIALACDILLAARSSSFGLVERRVGLTPSMGGSQRLASRAGAARAKELVMTGGIYAAEELASWNVVNRVLDDEGFDESTRAFARDLAAGPPLAHAATKAIIAAEQNGGIAAADEMMPETSGALFESEDLQGAVAAFLEHGGPGRESFAGR